MFSVANLILGIIGFSGGIATIYYAFYINHHIFFLNFIESKYGGGSGVTAYRLIGLAMCIFSLFVLIGRIDISNSGSAESLNQKKGSTSAPAPVKPAIPTNNGGSLIGQ